MSQIIRIITSAFFNISNVVKSYVNSNKRIFIIGFNKTGTRTLHNYFYKNLIPSVHWDQGRLAKTIKYNYENGIKILTGYEKYIVFSDMEDYQNLNYAYRM